MKPNRSLTVILAISGIFVFSAQSAFAQNNQQQKPLPDTALQKAQPKSHLEKGKVIDSLGPNTTLPKVKTKSHAKNAVKIHKNFDALRRKHAAALDHAKYKLDMRYANQLNALLVKAAQAKDYNAVLEITRKLVETNSAIHYFANTKLRRLLVSHEWTWVDLFAYGHPRLPFRFNENGSVKHISGWSETSSSWGFNRWKIVSPNEFYIENTVGNWFLYFKVDLRTKKVTLDRKKSAKGHLDKKILFGNKTKAGKGKHHADHHPHAKPEPTIVYSVPSSNLTPAKQKPTPVPSVPAPPVTQTQ